MAKRTQTPLNVTAGVRLSAAEVADLRVHAAHANLTMSNFMRTALKAYMLVNAKRHNLPITKEQSHA